MNRAYKVTAAAWVALVMGLSLSAHAGKGPHMVVDKFKMMDADRNNRISFEEHEAGSLEMFGEADLNNDGNVTAEEMAAMKEEKAKKHGRGMGGAHEISAREKIAKIDANGDGVLSRQEHNDGHRKIFQELDTDKNGDLTLDELQDGHERMMREKAVR